jgi:sulfur relay protein TusB/DsrH
MLIYHYRFAQLPRQWPCDPSLAANKPCYGLLLREDALFLLQQPQFWAQLPAALPLFALAEDAKCRGVSVSHPHIHWLDDVDWVNLCAHSQGVISWPA